MPSIIPKLMGGDFSVSACFSNIEPQDMACSIPTDPMSKLTVCSIPQAFSGGIRPPAELQADEIQIWRAPNEVEEQDYPKLNELLSADEVERARKFRFERHRRQYVIGRSLLRILIAAYLQTDARSIRFHYTPKGKPELAPADNASGLHFNVAHSGRIILLGFTRNRRIGIDVEEIRKDVEIDEIAQRFFSVSEQRCLASLPLSQRYDAFFRCWTRKEALLKGTGEGLSVGLDTFSVFSTPDKDENWVSTGDQQKWWIQDVDAGIGYAGAASVECRIDKPEATAR
jgi:4'-phosphopantetheinyl transferase